MAQDSEMKRAVFLVARALTKFAGEKGWKDFDYWIYYKINPELDKVYFIFVAEPLKGRDPYEATTEVWEFLEKELSGQPDLLRSLGLVVRSKAKVDEGGLYAIGPGYEEFFGPGYKEFYTFNPVQQK